MKRIFSAIGAVFLAVILTTLLVEPISGQIRKRKNIRSWIYLVSTYESLSAETSLKTRWYRSAKFIQSRKDPAVRRFTLRSTSIVGEVHSYNRVDCDRPHRVEGLGGRVYNSRGRITFRQFDEKGLLVFIPAVKSPLYRAVNSVCASYWKEYEEAQ